jgi:uncharacterized protein (UPF0276 family)
MDALLGLPVLGVGASLSLGAKPDPETLVRAPGGPSFIEYAGRVNVEEVATEVARIRATGARTLFHPSYINFCGSFANSRRWLEETAAHLAAVDSPWFAQDCAYCFWGDDPGYSTQLGYFVPPILSEASLELAIARVREVRAIVRVPVAVEPPPMCFAVGPLHVLDFFGRLANAADCAVLLDVGHLVSYELATGRRVQDGLTGFPRDRVVEVHIAGGRLESHPDGDVYIDAHDREILPAAWRMLDQLLPALPALRAVCFECEGADEARVISTLARVRASVLAHSTHAELVERVRRAS